jgi:crotonobetainyl-CoA:carnitine CoA-transferase CaiB-like acyl-CoA transferase
VLSPQQALEDPHVIARDFLKPIAYPGLEQPAPVADTPVDLSETPGKIRARAPTLGEHTDQILAELGYDQAAIAALREKRVV